jgi:hypothetical protein
LVQVCDSLTQQTLTLFLNLAQQQRVHASRQAAISHSLNQQRLAQLHCILNLAPRPPRVSAHLAFQPGTAGQHLPLKKQSSHCVQLATTTVD